MKGMNAKGVEIIHQMTEQFAAGIVQVISAETDQRVRRAEVEAEERLKAALAKALGRESLAATFGERGKGLSFPRMPTRAVRAPQLCPMPNCRGLAAPIFGMVCRNHKDVPKSVINRHRERYRKAKAEAKIAAKTNSRRHQAIV